MFFEFEDIGKLSTTSSIVIDFSKLFWAFEQILYGLNSTIELFD
jgi:hypothetical protein